MSDMIVLAFETEDGAMQMRDTLLSLQKQELITLSDAAVVQVDAKGKPHIKQLQSLVGAGALGGAFWGMLIGLLFFAPWLGLFAGALGGALGGKFADIGIDDKFIKEVGATIGPGHSALFLMVEKITADKVMPEVEKFHPTVLQTSLSVEQEEKLKAAFATDVETDAVEDAA